MPKVKGKCSACGMPLEVDVAALAGAEMAAALCLGCTEQQFLDGGVAILELRHGLEGARFPLGKVTIAGGAVEALADAGEHAAAFLARHVRGDWEEYGLCDEIQLTIDEWRQGWEATDDSGKINKSNLLVRRDRVNERVYDLRGEPAVGHHLSGRWRGDDCAPARGILTGGGLRRRE
jgi:hypothetical protein